MSSVKESVEDEPEEGEMEYFDPADGQLDGQEDIEINLPE